MLAYDVGGGEVVGVEAGVRVKLVEAKAQVDDMNPTSEINRSMDKPRQLKLIPENGMG